MRLVRQRVSPEGLSYSVCLVPSCFCKAFKLTSYSHREDGCSRRLKTKSHRHSQSRSSAVSTSPNARYSNAGHMFPQSELQQYTPADQALRLAHQPATSNMRAAAVASSFAGSVAHSYGGSPWQGSQ